MISIISFLIVISICVISHEGGHYLAARWRNVLIHEFSFGMGPSVWSRQKGETLWSVRAFPIGGFVRLEGEDASGEESRPDDYDPSRSLSAKKPWERLVVLASGAGVNLMLA
ncbi:MAG: site-2 protease family protein, partial [Synergistaceae bacterium]|nr:site-2 protease family protein [Synergistaceae bacterium]